MSFWQVPVVGIMGGYLANKFDKPTDANWYESSNILTITVAFMLGGANSDLFGRRYFILAGNVICCVSDYSKEGTLSDWALTDPC